MEKTQITSENWGEHIDRQAKTAEWLKQPGRPQVMVKIIQLGDEAMRLQNWSRFRAALMAAPDEILPVLVVGVQYAYNTVAIGEQMRKSMAGEGGPPSEETKGDNQPRAADNGSVQPPA